MNYRTITIKIKLALSLIAVVSSMVLAGTAQETSTVASSTASSTTGTVVPQLVNYTGVLTDVNGKPLSGIVGVTFSLYQQEAEGTALWSEIQNVQVSKNGRYSVMLGSTTSTGLPQDVFVNGEARWLGVQAEAQAEQPRTLLVAVPYALKAGDAETIGGLPASAFALAGGARPTPGGTKPAAATASSGAQKNAPPANPAVTGKGTVDYIPMWDTTSDIIDSIMFQKSSEIGINTTAPAATLDVNGKTDVRDTLTLFPKSTDNTLAVSGTTFKVDSTGKVTFVSGQTFPGAGTITGITTASGSGLSGGGTTGTLSLKVPAAGITNAMLANSKVTLNASTAGGLTVPGAMTLGDTYTIGLKTCSANQVLQYSGTAWACASAGTGTVTSVATGAGLTGGPITKTGTLSIANAGVTNAMLANSKVTLNSGTGITAPGAMTLGDTYTVSINTAVVPQLAAANTFTNTETIKNTSGTGAAINITNSGGGDGIDISTTGTYGIDVFSANVYGIVAFGTGAGGYFYGTDAGSSSVTNADAGFSTAASAFEFGGTQENFGFYSYAASPVGIGVYGQAVSPSNEGVATDSGFYPMGVWGDSGQEFGFGVFGSADDGWAYVGYNNSPSGFTTAWFENQETNDSSAEVLFSYGSGFGGQCSSNVSGDFSCNGTFAAVAPVAGGSKKVALNAIHSPDNWFEDAGSGQLSGGEAVVNIESLFGETINTGVEYHVFLTPNGDCKGLYVAQKSAGSFVVKELGGGTSNIAFDYRIMAKRKGFEQVRLVDRTKAFSLKNRPIKRAGAAAKRMPSAQEMQKKMQPPLKPRPVATVSTLVNK
jgi:hypothetical protein